jgi:hypothetical protein
MRWWLSQSRQPDQESKSDDSEAVESVENHSADFDIVNLQRAVGNQSVQRMISDSSPGLPKSLTTSSSGAGGEPLPKETLEKMEDRFGEDFGDVRIHSDAQATQSAHDLEAEAYTRGRDIYFAPGKYAPNSSEGERLIAHELTHVVQQDTGSDLRSNSFSVGPPDNQAEREAETVSHQVVSGHAASPALKVSGQPAQRQGGTSPNTHEQTEHDLKSDFTVFVADPHKATDVQFAGREARADAARILKSGSLSAEDRQLVNAKLRFFQGEAWTVYGREIKPALEKVTTADANLPAATGPPVEDILRLDQTVPIKGLAQNQSNYIDHFRGSLTSAPLGSDITLTPNKGPANQTGISIPKADFSLDQDPLAGSSMGQNQVYKSRAIAEEVVADLMKQTPGWQIYTYYLQDDIIVPTTLSDTTVPNLMPFIRQQREQNLADIAATAELAKAVALWYVGARFPIKIPSGGAAGEAAKQAEKEVLKQGEEQALKQGEKEGLKQEGKELAKVARKPPIQPSAPSGWKGSLNAFGKEIGWPAQGEAKVAAEAVDLAKLRSAGVTEQWAIEQAQIYREVARMNPSNPSAALRADWLEKIAQRLGSAP